MKRLCFRLLHRQYGRAAFLLGSLLRDLARIWDSCSPGRQPCWKRKRKEDKALVTLVFRELYELEMLQAHPREETKQQ